MNYVSLLNVKDIKVSDDSYKVLYEQNYFFETF